MLDAYGCNNECGISFCQDDIPQNKICEYCGAIISPKKKLSQMIKEKYEILCLNCSQKMFLIDFEQHFKANCGIKLEPLPLDFEFFKSQIETQNKQISFLIQKNEILQQQISLLKKQDNNISLLMLQFKKQNEKISALEKTVSNLREEILNKNVKKNFFFFFQNNVFLLFSF